MDRAEVYEKIMGMAAKGMERVHNTYMTEMDKAEPDKMVEVAKDYAMSMMGFATLMSTVGILKPLEPVTGMALGWGNKC